MFHTCLTITTLFQSLVLISLLPPLSFRKQPSSWSNYALVFFISNLDQKKALKLLSTSLCTLAKRIKMENQKAWILMRTNFTRTTLPIWERNIFLQKWILPSNLSIRGLQSSFFNLEVIKGTPKYFIGRAPISKPTRSTNFLFSLSLSLEKNILLLFALAFGLDHEWKFSNAYLRIVEKHSSALKNNIKSSAKHRWVIFHSSPFLWNLKLEMRALWSRRPNKTSMAITKRYKDKGSPCLSPLKLSKSPTNLPLRLIKYFIVVIHFSIHYTINGGNPKQLRIWMMNSQLTES